MKIPSELYYELKDARDKVVRAGTKLLLHDKILNLIIKGYEIEKGNKKEIRISDEG